MKVDARGKLLGVLFLAGVGSAMRKERTAMIYARRMSMMIVAPMAVMAVLVAVPVQASAESLVPFHATTAATYTAAPCDPVPSLCITAAGSGHATHLGRIREETTVVVDLASDPAPGCHTETRETTLTAANGDKIMLNATGWTCETGPTTVTAVDAYMVTGGTGRFIGARGSGTIITTVDQANGTALSIFRGTLSSPDQEEEDNDEDAEAGSFP